MKKMANRAKAPSHFFKVILQSTIEEKKLKIPEKFASRFGNELSAVATLMVPNGRIWHVGMTKEKRMIWLDDGWHAFVKYYGICVGYFLVFKYAKNSTFDVHVFDITTCEIDYLYNFVEPKHEDQSPIQGDEMESKDSIKIVGFTTLEKNGMHKSQASLHRKRRLNKTAEIFSAPSPLAVQDVDLETGRNKFQTAAHTWEDKHRTEVIDGDGMVALLEEMGICISRSRLFLAAEERQRAITAARLFEPKNPSFMVIMQTIERERRKGYLFIPARFTNKHLSTVPKFIKVRISDGREWSFQTRLNHAGLHLTGWGRFLGQMNLDRGDICIFELIKMEDVFLKLSVFHACAVNLKS